MIQHKIKKQGKLLDSNGHLIEAGFSFKPVIKYNPENIKAKKWRIKEWDYFLIGNKDYAISLTIANNRYMGIAGMQFFDFKNQKKYDYTKFILKPSFSMPKNIFEGEISYQSEKIQLSFKYEKNQVHLRGKTKDMTSDKDIEIDVFLKVENEDNCHMVIPFHNKPKLFYFNQKYNHLAANGSFKIGDKRSSLDDNFAVLDWGRGVWPWKVLWYWSSMSGILENGKRIGFNLGYGFGDNKHASENMIFYDGKGYKLDEVKFIIPDQYTDTWIIIDDKKELDLTFQPIYDNKTKINYCILGQDAHQVFGLFSGTIKIKEETISIVNLFGFAERVKNRW